MSGNNAGKNTGARIELRGARREGPAFQFAFNDHVIDAYDGETIAAALIAAGEWTFRTTREGDGRGPFCGMGVCGECLVSVDGAPRRACFEKAAPGLRVAAASAQADYAPQKCGASGKVRTLTPELLIVGAGPASLAAAGEAAAAGVDVLVIDERAKAGGQYFKQPADGFAVTHDRLDAQFREGAALYEKAKAAGASFLFRTTAWSGAADPLEILAVSPDAPLRIAPRFLFLAQGAYERNIAVPGWTTPGVMTTGAAQTFLRAYLTTPGKRVLVAGNGPLNLQLARELSDAGADVVAVAEAARAPGPGKALDAATMALASPGLMLEGAGHLLTLARRGAPVLYGSALSGVDGDGRVEAARVRRIGRDGAPLDKPERRFEVDAVCIGYGFAPQSELARALGCAFEFSASRGVLEAVRAADGQSSVDNVFIIGDGGGLGGAKAAIAQGALAARSVASALGRDGDLRRAAQLARELRRCQRFQKALWRLFDAPLITSQFADADTFICRCESVRRAAFEALRDDGSRAIGSVKRATRAGMGRCQGRYCASIAAALVSGGPLGEASLFAPRAPGKPVRLGDIAAYAED